MTTTIPTPSKEAVAFASEWLGIEHQEDDWDVGIIGGDTLQAGNYFYNLIDDMGDGPPRSVSERFGMEVEIQTAFAELLDQFVERMTGWRSVDKELPGDGDDVVAVQYFPVEPGVRKTAYWTTQIATYTVAEEEGNLEGFVIETDEGSDTLENVTHWCPFPSVYNLIKMLPSAPEAN